MTHDIDEAKTVGDKIIQKKTDEKSGKEVRWILSDECAMINFS